MIPIPFLALTFAISLAGFLCILAIPAARSPESAIGLPFWLIMVWGPSLAALVLSFQNGQTAELLARAVRIETIPVQSWLLVLAPLLILLLLRQYAPDEPSTLGIGPVLALVVFNLILGPLGEELGWRGVLQEHLTGPLEWLEASLLVGVIWLVWHLPLWLIDSPHSQIALPLFGVHVMLYSIIIGAAYAMSGGSILPAILIHLTVNVASNLAVFAGFQQPNAWFTASILPFAMIAVGACVMVFMRTGSLGVRWLMP